MNSIYINFLRNLLIFSFFLGAITLTAGFFLPEITFSPALPYLFFFFISTTLISYYYLVKSMNKKFIKFVNAFLFTTALKLFLYVAVMIAYVLINRKDAIPFMLSFFLLYLCYTVFEVLIIIRKTRNPSPGDSARL